MSLLDTILQAQGGKAVQQIGSQLGLGQDQATSALSALIPALAAGVQQQTTRPDGLSSLLSALASGQHQRYVDNPATLSAPETVQDGNAILGHIFGSKDVSRQVASQAAAETGVGADVLKKMLPMAAALVMGAMAQHAGRDRGAAASNPLGAATAALTGGGGGSSLMNVLAATLSQSGNSSVAGSVGGLLSKMLRG